MNYNVGRNDDGKERYDDGCVEESRAEPAEEEDIAEGSKEL